MNLNIQKCIRTRQNGNIEKKRRTKKTAHNMDLASLLRGGKSGGSVLQSNIDARHQYL